MALTALGRSTACAELFTGGAVNEKCDLWSFATLLWEMHTGEVPWKALVSPVQARFRLRVHATIMAPRLSSH
jgi:hypothetical protein